MGFGPETPQTNGQINTQFQQSLFDAKQSNPENGRTRINENPQTQVPRSEIKAQPTPLYQHGISDASKFKFDTRAFAASIKNLSWETQIQIACFALKKWTLDPETQKRDQHDLQNMKGLLENLTQPPPATFDHIPETFTFSGIKNIMHQHYLVNFPIVAELNKLGVSQRTHEYKHSTTTTYQKIAGTGSQPQLNQPWTATYFQSKTTHHPAAQQKPDDLARKQIAEDTINQLPNCKLVPVAEKIITSLCATDQTYDNELVKEFLKTITDKLNSEFLIEFKAKMDKEFWSNEAGGYYRKFHDLQKSLAESEPEIDDKYFSNKNSTQFIAHMVHELVSRYTLDGFEGQSIEKHLNRLITEFICMEKTECYKADTKKEFTRMQVNLAERKDHYCTNPPDTNLTTANTMAQKVCTFMVHPAVEPNAKAEMALKIAKLCGFEVKG